jgi:hypothetical protein
MVLLIITKEEFNLYPGYIKGSNSDFAYMSYCYGGHHKPVYRLCAHIGKKLLKINFQIIGSQELLDNINKEVLQKNELFLNDIKHGVLETSRQTRDLIKLDSDYSIFKRKSAYSFVVDMGGFFVTSDLLGIDIKWNKVSEIEEFLNDFG